jgi:hypothetical protein
MTQTLHALHEIVMQLNAEEGLTPDALWALKHLAEMKGDELAAAQKRVAVLEKALESMLFIFDRALPKGTIGRNTCDAARAALAGDGDA